MRHVLRVIPSYLPYVTGPANQARSISLGLSSAGYRSRIVTTDLAAGQAPRFERLDGIEVVRLPIRVGFMQYHVPVGAWKELTTSQADIIHVHSYRNYLADVASVVAKLRNIPFVLHLHGSLTGYQQIVNGRYRWVYKAYDTFTHPLPTLRADRIIVSTSSEASEAEGYGLDRKRIHVIPMGVDPDQYTFPDVIRNPTKILFVGRLSEDRNVEQLLRSLARIVDLSWSCAIVGGAERRSYASASGYLETLKELAANLGIIDRVTFTGPLYDEALRRAYASSGIFVYPSRYENFGQTILEAAAAGCVLVTTGVGVANDLVQEGRSGFIVDHDSLDLLVQRLKWLLEHRDEQISIGRTAHAQVKRNYSWPTILQSYTDLYEDLL